MEFAAFTFPKAMANLKKPGMAGSQQPFHAYFGGSLQKMIAGNFRFDPYLRRQDGKPERSIDLQIITLLKENPNRPDYCGPLFKTLAGDHL
jgi:hypothetical protein